jgi:hypothetical protein
MTDMANSRIDDSLSICAQLRFLERAFGANKSFALVAAGEFLTGFEFSVASSALSCHI